MPDDDNAQLKIDVGVMKEQLRAITEDMKEARHARRNAYIAQEKRDELLFKIDHRLEKVETFMAGASPTLNDFNALKLKAEGAGTLGKFIWIGAGMLIGLVASLSGMLSKLFDNIK